jgi:hypothetical protein
MKTLLTYDVSDKQTEVKDAMLKIGYEKRWTSNNSTYYLPNTTLWKNEISPSTALADIRAVTNGLKVRLVRAIAVDFGNWDGIPGDSN